MPSGWQPPYVDRSGDATNPELHGMFCGVKHGFSTFVSSISSQQGRFVSIVVDRIVEGPSLYVYSVLHTTVYWMWSSTYEDVEDQYLARGRCLFALKCGCNLQRRSSRMYTHIDILFLFLHHHISDMVYRLASPALTARALKPGRAGFNSRYPNLFFLLFWSATFLTSFEFCMKHYIYRRYLWLSMYTISLTNNAKVGNDWRKRETNLRRRTALPLKNTGKSYKRRPTGSIDLYSRQQCPESNGRSTCSRAHLI